MNLYQFYKDGKPLYIPVQEKDFIIIARSVSNLTWKKVKRG